MLEKLFTSKTRIKILGHLFFYKDKSYIRELSRVLRIPVSAIKREVDNLISLGIIKIEEERLRLNKECIFLEELRSIFVKTDFVVYPIKNALANNKKIKYAFIFGSFAKGEFSSESDVDLMVVGKIKSFDLYKKLRPIEHKTKRDINPVVWDLKDLKEKKKTGFVRDIFSKKIIMLKGDENEIREIVK